MGIKSKRVVFTFDDASVKTLQQMTEEGSYCSMAECVRESLQITQAIQSQAQRGFTEIILRNPNTNQERTLIYPRLRIYK